MEGKGDAAAVRMNIAAVAAALSAKGKSVSLEGGGKLTGPLRENASS